MAVTLEEFVKQLEDSGIIAGDVLQEFIPPKATPEDAEELALELVRKKKLTKFQAEEISKGQGKSLVLGNYVLVEKIGAGGMGQVFKARHRVMERLVAVKLLPSAMTKDQAAIARFHREVKAAAKINHANIVTAYDADQADGVHFLVMELVDGSDLSALVKRNGPLSLENAVNCILQAARGLEAAHLEGIVHRDIKPANLLLDKKGTVKILDMGLARLHGDGDGPQQAELTSTGTIMGTVDYMSPEQALDTKSADARADIYALGCSLFYVLTGKAIYDGDTLMKKLVAHREHPIPSLRSVRPDVSERLEAIFKRMVAKKTEDRYPTMTEVIHDLQQCPVNQASSSSIALPGVTDSSGFQAFGINSGTASATIEATRQRQPTVTYAPSEPATEATMLSGDMGQVTSPQTLTSARSDADQNKTVRQPATAAHWWQDRRVQIAGGIVTVLVLLAAAFLRPGTMNVSRIAKPDDATSQAGGHGGKKKPLAFQTPGFDQWVKEVSDMPAERQLESVAMKLQELNPGFDGKFTGGDKQGQGVPRIEDGIVLELGIVTDKVTDISPLRAFVGLKFLICGGSDYGKGRLTDLSPLKAMSLTKLSLHDTPVNDLSALKEMRSLRMVTLAATQVSDVTPLKGLSLEVLYVFSSPITDLGPLQGMRSLTNVILGYMDLIDLSSLKGLSLTSFSCTNTKVSDLTPLAGMRLVFLGCNETQVSDLSPLETMKLERLDCSKSNVSDLSPLKGMKLTFLDCHDTKVSDLSPLKNMPLSVMRCDFKSERDTELLRSIKTLETINDKPAAEFWKEVEEQQRGKKLAFQTPGFDQWMKDVQAMPAEKQVEAISKKLMELNPEFDGKVTGWKQYGVVSHDLPQIENGVVTEFGYIADEITDISPLRALSGLKRLTSKGSSGKRKLSDLSPLGGLKLECFDCSHLKVSDLTPLMGMPLTVLLCDETEVSDLSPLKGMPLREIWGGNSPYSDLSPVSSLSLRMLACDRTHVTDLTPLKGMELEGIYLTFADIANGMDSLRQMKSLERIGTSGGTSWTPAEFWKKYDAGEFGKPLAFQTPGFDQWVKEVQAMPAEKQVEAVSKKLMELMGCFSFPGQSILLFLDRLLGFKFHRRRVAQ